MINTIIFDLGKVLVDFHPIEGMKKIGFTDDAVKAFEENIFSGLWEECDAMPLSDKEIRGKFKNAVAGYEKYVDLLWDNITEVTSVYDYSYDWLKNLKERGYKIYILSNFGQCAFETNSKLYNFLELADGKVVSYAVSMVKPDRRIYEYLIKTFKIEPEKAVFLDDRAVNIEAAIECGLKGIVFENYARAEKELEKMLEE